MNIRDIERIIDCFHKSHPVFSGSKEQVSLELLSTFEDLCHNAIIGSAMNPASLQMITSYMDALNQALLWIQESELPIVAESIAVNISEERYKQCVSFLTEYAYPYSVICSGYISFSRKRLLADVEGNIVSFNLPSNYNNSVWSDLLREINQSELGAFATWFSPEKIANTYSEILKSIRIEGKKLCYELTDKNIDSFLEIANQQWDITKTLPISWKFDHFSMDEYKKVWTCIAALSYVHFFACFAIQDPQIRLQNNTIIQPLKYIIDWVASKSEVQKGTVEEIIKYITFEASKRNVDIMYQPIVKQNNDMLIITPMLFIGSRPERNLLAVVGSKGDSEHFKEVNDLEGLMIQEIKAVIPQIDTLKLVTHKKLGMQLPDIDFGLLDMVTNTALLCELKWFTEADSTKEVYAREDEITHGCNQVDSIMEFAMLDRKNFIKQVFGVENGDCVDLFCCVVARHNIRTQHKYVPVIDLKTLLKLFSTKSINSVFHIIRNHEYEEPLPQNASITHRIIKYGEYIFKIPAICFESIPT